ncbi:hypothetical protein BH20ACI1_BH20ACI1_23170 [soil metagenome]
MKFSHIFFLMLLTLNFSLGVFAQNTKSEENTKSKEKLELEDKAFELLEQITNESALLKLPENRSFAARNAAGLWWEKDEKRARQLFQNAADELIQIQNAPLNRRQLRNAQNAEFYREIIVNNLRGQLAYSINGKDAEFALQILLATRSAELETAVQTYRQLSAQVGKIPDLSKYKQDERTKLERAVHEIRLEEEIKKEIAKKDPQKLAEFIRAAYANGTLGYNDLDDLDALNKKDHDLAQKILSEIMSKLSSANFSEHSKWFAAFWIYRRFLAAKTKSAPQKTVDNKKELELDEKSVEKIANQEFDYLLTKDTTENASNFIERILYIKRILPERFSEIKNKYERAKGNFREWAEDAETTEKLGDDPTLDQIIKNTDKLADYSKANYYRKAIDKLLITESEEKTAQTLAKIPDEKDREKSLDYLNSLSAAKKAAGENPTEAKQAALQIKSEPDRIAKLIALAISYQQKKTEDSQKIADDLMNEAVKLVSETPETSSEYAAILPVISGYATVNPKRAFELTSQIISQSNELLDAYVLLANYQDNNYPNVSENEILLGGQDGYQNYQSAYREIAKKLATSDFEKAKNLIETFKRADVRIIAKLIVIESLLAR